MSQISSKESSNDKSESAKDNCSTRIIPFYIDENKNIYLVMVRVGYARYGDWTTMGGRCKDIIGNCPKKQSNQKLIDCLYKELEEESHLSIMRQDLTLCSPSLYYFDDEDRHNNIRFAQLNKNRDVVYVKKMFFDEDLLKEFAKYENEGKDYLETIDIEFLPLHGTFLKYAENTFYKKKVKKNEKIDYSILKPFYGGFNAETPAQLVEKIDAFINKCISK